MGRAFFENFGTVLEAFVSYDRHTGRPRGFGFVVFEDPAVADKVVSLQHTIDRREVRRNPTTAGRRVRPRADVASSGSRPLSWPCLVLLHALRASGPPKSRRRQPGLGSWGDEGRLGKMLSSKLSDVRAQVEAKKAVPKEEHPSGRVLDSSNPQRTKKIFVGGLAPSVDENVLKGYFERFGEVRRHPGAAETFTEISSC